MINPAAAIEYVTGLFSLLRKKRQENDALIAEIKNKAIIIDGVPYIPTGFNNANLKDFLEELNNAYNNEIAANNDNSNSESISTERIVITESESQVAPVALTDCPTNIDDVFPKYTEDEVNTVYKELVEECETRNTTSDLIKDISLSEAIDAKCDIEKPVIEQPPIFLTDSDILDEVIEESPEPANASKKPKKTLVTLTSIDAAGGDTVKKIKKVGDTVNCGDAILQVGAKTVNSPVANGVIKEIYVGETAKNGNKLFLVEELQLSAEDSAQKIIDMSTEASAEIQKLSKLKEDIGIIEPKVWLHKIIYAIFEGQYQGFTLPDTVSAQAREEIKEKPLRTILGELSNVILPFANNITLNNIELAKWGNDDYNINAPNTISYADLFLLDPNNFKSFAYKHNDGNTLWSGEIKNLRDDLLDKALELSKITDATKLENASNELRIKEKGLLSSIEKLANETYNKVFQYGLKIGYYYRLNPSNIITNLVNNDINALLQANLDRAKINYENLYAQYTPIRSEIDRIEKIIDDLPNALTNVANSGCVLPEGSAPAATLINGESINIISWPITEQDLVLPKDDDNFKGNPSKNSPAVTDIRYWRKYCLNATLVNFLPIYWPIGLLIPTPGGIVRVPLPIIWKPFVTIPTPFCVIVVGIALCGVCPAPFVYLVNPGWPFPIGIVKPRESYFLTGIRGPSKIDNEISSKVLDAIPTIVTPLVYRQDGVIQQKPISIDAAPRITKLLPLIKDDLPAFERLSITNLPFILYLTKWCKAGKKTMGFFES